METSAVAGRLLQMSQVQQRQAQVDFAATEQARQARQQAVDQNMENASKQVERVTAIKEAALQQRRGGIDVWA